MPTGPNAQPVAVPPLWRPLRRLHHRHVEKLLGEAASASSLLSVSLDVALLRKALQYHSGLGLLALVPIGIIDGIVAGMAVTTMKGGCTPGGLLPARGEALAACPTHQEKVALGTVILIFSLAVWALRTLMNAAGGVRIRPCYQALVPALRVLEVCGRVHAAGGHLAAAELSVSTAALGTAVVDGSGHAANDYGARSSTRAATRGHARKVAAVLESVADRLLSDREGAAKLLADHASAIAGQTADGRFTSLLGAGVWLPEPESATPESPDRADGRRLALSAVIGLVIAIGVGWVTNGLDLPVYVGAPLATFSIPLVAFLVMAYRYGLAEALRLIATLISVRNGEAPPGQPQPSSGAEGARNPLPAQRSGADGPEQALADRSEETGASAAGSPSSDDRSTAVAGRGAESG
ncbi:hypothetical protein [Kitasatospora sp. NRRL B-11411]|uniref:hypothetical protein n=1 Tax=Kitasatospora sp. NRRL B-11411 TaxID=1463822 RepID=UPI0012FF1687|nr:hypothetical protein [Kitasatospora sp. NRRL B-11411]